MKQSRNISPSPTLYKGQKIKVYKKPFKQGKLISGGLDYQATVDEVFIKKSIFGEHPIVMVRVIHAEFNSPHVVSPIHIYPIMEES